MSGLERELSRYQWGLDVAGAGGAAAIVAAALFILYLVDHDAREDLGFRRDRAMTLLQTADEIRETHKQLQRELPVAREQHRRLRERIPREPQVAEFLAQLSGLAEDADVAIRSFDPQTQASTEQRMDVMVHLAIDGEYANICRFLWDIDRLPRLSRFRSMTLTAPDAQQTMCSLELDLLIFSLPEEEGGGPIAHTLSRGWL
jgi:Tfp pilus assembly protein PilO